MSYVIKPETVAKLIASLEHGDDLSPTTRREVIQSLYDLSLFQAIAEKQNQRGREIAIHTWTAAAITNKLIQKYGVKVKAAAWAAAPNATSEEHEAIKRAYRNLKTGKAPTELSIHPDLFREAEERLDPDGKLFLQNFNTQKSGNK